MMTVAAALPTGLLLPDSILQTDAFKVLATFVAINTVMYATLAILKLLPKGYALSWFRGRNRRGQNRSIYPEPPAAERRLRQRASARPLRVTAAWTTRSREATAGMAGEDRGPREEEP